MSRPTSCSSRLRLWALLTEAGVLSSLAAIPYALRLRQRDLHSSNAKRVAAGKRPIGPGTLVARAAVQGHVVFGPVVAIGLKLGRQLGLGAPHLEHWLQEGRDSMSGGDAARLGLVGLATGAGVIAVDIRCFGKAREQLVESGVTPLPPWQGLLASGYAAVGEELLLRLGVQTALAAGLARATMDAAAPPSGRTMHPAIIGSSVLFALAHLPATHAAGGRGVPLIARTLVLNGLPGLVFGRLYWRKGLEASMIAHGTTAVLLTVGLPVYQSRTRRGG